MKQQGDRIILKYFVLTKNTETLNIEQISNNIFIYEISLKEKDVYR